MALNIREARQGKGKKGPTCQNGGVLANAKEIRGVTIVR